MSAQEIDTNATPVCDENVVVGYEPSRGEMQGLVLGSDARLRSGTVIYSGSEIGDRFQTGHNVTIREESQIGDDVSIWSNTVVDYGCRIGNRVKIHSNGYISQHTVIEDDAFLAPGVVLANDLYPGYASSAAVMAGPYIEAGAQIGVNTTILPYVRIGRGAIVGAGSVVTKDVPPNAVVYGNPAVVAGARSDLGDVDTRVRDRAARAPSLHGVTDDETGAHLERAPSRRVRRRRTRSLKTSRIVNSERVKRSLDVTTASCLLVLASPVMLAIAVVVKRTSNGPALFRQDRVGYRKQPFTMFKFRTMHHDCDDTVHREYVTHMLTGVGDPPPNGANGSTVQKLTDDPRITRVGRTLRRMSLDELPQLLNVLRGEMSLVGPRPMLAWEAELLDDCYDVRFAVKPGITGWWQVQGRNNLSMREAIELDVSYVYRRNLLLDLGILASTVPTVAWAAITGRGVG